jgi:uncharacterized protein YbjT (DUF2867 family)
MTDARSVLVLGAYGFIGSGIVRALVASGHRVTGLGRSARTAHRTFPDLRWVLADLKSLTVPADWAAHLDGIDCVVNAAGALQDNPKDDLAAVHDRAICALVTACETAGVTRFVQVSAPGATPAAGTRFMRSKAGGDAFLMASRLDWVVLRPGIVVGADAYGGTALLRALAAVPLVQPIVHASSLVQTVALADVTDAVLDAVEGRVPAGTDADLVEPQPRSLIDTVAKFRHWLGFAPALATVSAPFWSARLVGWGADGLAWLGWRGPLRSTALEVMAAGVLGDAAVWRAATGRDLMALEETFARLPATAQERWFARLYMLLPLLVATLSAFWLVSGLVGLWRMDAAAAVLADTGLSAATARALVVAGAVADMALGLLVLVRRAARPACFAMIALTLAYLVSGTVLTPELWADPLGPFVKTIPAAVLALVAWAVLEPR